MRRFSHTPRSRDPAVNAAAALLLALRNSTSAAAAAVAPGSAAQAQPVRTRGFGPSEDLLKGADPSARLLIETQLHPRDAALQKSVLAMFLPEAQLSVVPRRRVDLFERPPETPSAAGTAAPPADDSVSAAVLESALDTQLTNMANTIVGRLSEQTRLQLSGLEVAQAECQQTLANLIINSVRRELTAARAGSTGPGPAAAAAPLDAAALARSLSAAVEKVVRTVAGQASKQEAERLRGLDDRVRGYFDALEKKLTDKVRATPVKASAEGVGEDAREMVAEVVQAATEQQREMLLQIVQELQESGSGGGGEAVDTAAITGSVEGLLSDAVDNIRRDVAEEVKKLKGAVGKGKAHDAVDVEVFVRAVNDVTASVKVDIQAVADNTESLLQKQEALAEVVEEIRSLLRSGAVGATTDRSDSPVPTAVPEALSQSVEQLHESLLRVEAAVEGNRDAAQQQLLDVAAAIHASINSAQTTRLLERIEELVSARLPLQPPSPTPTAREAEVHASPALSADETRSVIEECVTPQIQQLVATLEAAAETQQAMVEQRLVEFASTLSSSFQDMLARQQRLAAETGKAAAAPDSPPVTPAAPSLEEIREVVEQTVKAEMDKPHDVDLSQMYKIVDALVSRVNEGFEASRQRLEAMDEKLSAATTAPAATTTTTARREEEEAEEEEEEAEEEPGAQAPAAAAGGVTAAEIQGIVDAAVAELREIAFKGRQPEPAAQPPPAPASADPAASAALVEEVRRGNEAVLAALRAERPPAPAGDKAQHPQAAVPTELSERLAALQESLRSAASTADVRAVAEKLETLRARTDTDQLVSDALAELRAFVKRADAADAEEEKSGLRARLPALAGRLGEAAEALQGVSTRAERQMEDLQEQLAQMAERQDASAEPLLRQVGEMLEATETAQRESSRALEEAVRRLEERLEASSAADAAAAEDRPVAELLEDLEAQLQERLELLAVSLERQSGRADSVVSAVDAVREELGERVTRESARTTEAVAAAVEAQTARVSGALDTHLQHLSGVADGVRDLAQRVEAGAVGRKGAVPLWWLAAHPVLVCGTIVVTLYYMFACLLVVLVPAPETPTPPTTTSSAVASAASSVNTAAVGLSAARGRRVSRFADQYL